MADCSVKAVKMARILAIAHIIVGFLLFCFGIADRLVETDIWTDDAYFGIWIGIWMCIAGGFGIPGTRRERAGSRNAFAGVFMGFSITSAVLGGLIIYCYGAVTATISERHRRSTYGYYWYREQYSDADLAISIMILILGITEFVIGIWAAVCCCLMKPCTCCGPNPVQQGQVVVYTANPAGYIMAQGPAGVPVAVPVQTGDQPLIVQVDSSSNAMATDSPPQQPEKPPLCV